MTDISMLSGLRVLVVGLGREGIALSTFLAGHGISVMATDRRPAEQLEAISTSLQAAGVSLTLGQHPLSLLDETDILFVSPGVPLETPFVQQAKERSLPLCTESKLFCFLCLAPVLAITGSSGKTTTTTILSKIMEAHGQRTWVGGNIGQPLIGLVDQIQPHDAVVMELSSFQLEYFHARLNKNVTITDPQLAALLGDWSSPISAILNITPNHLDRHPSMKDYVRAKRALINYQGQKGVLIMGLDNDMTRTIGNQFGARVRWFSQEAHMPYGAGIVNDELVLFGPEDQPPQQLANKQEIKLRGPHNLYNVLAACLMAREAGASIEAMRQVITSFTGVEHRLQLVREHQQVLYYNDSISTSPERLIAALYAFNEPIVLLAGGRDKHLPWEEAARLILHRTQAVVLFGEAADLLEKEINAVRHEVNAVGPTLYHCLKFDDAVQQAIQIAQPGNVILLSPGCASFDAFQDFAQRGQRFKELVSAL